MASRAGWKSTDEELLGRAADSALLLGLEKSRGLELQAPEYLRGLIALCAISRMRRSRWPKPPRQKAPWLYEAEELAGDAYAARGLHAKTRGLVEPARQSLTDALSRYQAALAIGRSVSHLYEKAAEMLLRASMRSIANKASRSCLCFSRHADCPTQQSPLHRVQSVATPRRPMRCFTRAAPPPARIRTRASL